MLVLLMALVGLTAIALIAITPIIDHRRRVALRRTLADVCRVFEAAGIDYWCDFGTLLGFYREHDIILGDKDVDLSIVATEKGRIMALAPEFARHGYQLTDRGGRAGRLIRIYDRRTRYYADVYPYIQQGAVLRSVLASPQEDVPVRLVERRVPASFLGATLLVPADVEAMLVHRYGPAFATPRRGDKGAGRPYSRVRSVLEDLQDNVLGLWSWVRQPGSMK
jgi:hypothetical protein